MMAIGPGQAHRILSAQVIGEISHHEEGIIPREVVDQRTEQLAIAIAEVTHLHQADRFSEFGNRFNHFPRPVAALLEGSNFFHGLAE